MDAPLQRVAVTHNRRGAAEELTSGTQLTPDEVLQSPYVLVRRVAYAEPKPLAPKLGPAFLGVFQDHGERGDWPLAVGQHGHLVARIGGSKRRAAPADAEIVRQHPLERDIFFA